MKIGFSTACFYPQPLEDAVERITALGLRTIEIFFNTESEFQQPFLGQLKERLAYHGLSVVSVHPFTSLMEGILFFSEYGRRAEDGFAQYRRYFQAARELGAQYFTLHGERYMPGLSDTPEAFQRKVERYRRLCEVAADEGMIVAQENVAWCRSREPAYLAKLYEQVPQLRYTLDIKQANRVGQSWKEYFDVMAPRLVNVHINDFDQTHGCLLPGEGLLDYREVFQHLKAAGYDRQVLIEVYSSNFASDEQISRSVCFLQNQAHAVGYALPEKYEKSARNTSICTKKMV